MDNQRHLCLLLEGLETVCFKALAEHVDFMLVDATIDPSAEYEFVTPFVEVKRAETKKRRRSRFNRVAVLDGRQCVGGVPNIGWNVGLVSSQWNYESRNNQAVRYDSHPWPSQLAPYASPIVLYSLPVCLRQLGLCPRPCSPQLRLPDPLCWLSLALLMGLDAIPLDRLRSEP